MTGNALRDAVRLDGEPGERFRPGFRADLLDGRVIAGTGAAVTEPVACACPRRPGFARRDATLVVCDAARAICMATELYDGAEPVNVGAGFESKIRDLAELVARLTGFEGEIRWDPTKPDGQPRRSVDTSRAERLFGFRASTPFEEGLRATIAWYRSHSC